MKKLVSKDWVGEKWYKARKLYLCRLDETPVDRCDVVRRIEEWGEVSHYGNINGLKRKWIRRLSRYSSVWVIGREGECLGYAWACWRNKSVVWHDSLPIEDGVPRIYNVWVSPGYRGRGIATKILRTIMYDLKSIGFELITSVIEDTNTPSIGLHKKMGFKNGPRNILIKFFGVNVISLLGLHVNILVGNKRNDL